MYKLRARSQTLVGGPDAIKGSLIKVLTLVRGNMKNITINFQGSRAFMVFDHGVVLTNNFMAKKGPRGP